jgi:hypothetical protein
MNKQVLQEHLELILKNEDRTIEKSGDFKIVNFEINKDFFEGHEGSVFNVSEHTDIQEEFGIVSFAYCNNSQEHLGFKPNDISVYMFCLDNLYDNQAEGVDPMLSVRKVFSNIASLLNNIEV